MVSGCEKKAPYCTFTFNQYTSPQMVYVHYTVLSLYSIINYFRITILETDYNENTLRGIQNNLSVVFVLILCVDVMLNY